MVVPDPRDRDDRDDRDQTADEQAWQAIIENYGDRPELDEQPPERPADPPVQPRPDAPFGGRFGDPAAFDVADELAGEPADDDPEEQGYRPPPPPPLPTLAPDRALAWAGVFGSPLVLLAALLFRITLPTWLGYLLVVGFVGGFAYLVVKMPREPRDPWDDGAQV